MNVYVNAFRISFKDDGTEVILQFYQEHPNISETGEVQGVTSELVDSLVMNPAMILNLAHSVESTLNYSEREKNEQK